MTPPQFVAYYLVLILVNQLTLAQTNWTVGDIIRMATLETAPQAPQNSTVRMLYQSHLGICELPFRESGSQFRFLRKRNKP